MEAAEAAARAATAAEALAERLRAALGASTDPAAVAAAASSASAASASASASAAVSSARLLARLLSDSETTSASVPGGRVSQSRRRRDRSPACFVPKATRGSPVARRRRRDGPRSTRTRRMRWWWSASGRGTRTPRTPRGASRQSARARTRRDATADSLPRNRRDALRKTLRRDGRVPAQRRRTGRDRSEPSRRFGFYVREHDGGGAARAPGRGGEGADAVLPNAHLSEKENAEGDDEIVADAVEGEAKGDDEIVADAVIPSSSAAFRETVEPSASASGSPSGRTPRRRNLRRPEGERAYNSAGRLACIVRRRSRRRPRRGRERVLGGDGTLLSEDALPGVRQSVVVGRRLGRRVRQRGEGADLYDDDMRPIGKKYKRRFEQFRKLVDALDRGGGEAAG